jgi:hypothetical protein
MSPKNAATLTFIEASRVSPRHLTSDNLQGLKIFGGTDHEEDLDRYRPRIDGETCGATITGANFLDILTQILQI